MVNLFTLKDSYLTVNCMLLLMSQDITALKEAVSEANKTEEQHYTWTDEQIHILLSTVADLRQRVASLEKGSEQSVSNVKIHT